MDSKVPSLTLPEPTLRLTLPSIHDNTPLSCRVYHPLSLSPSLKAPRWEKHIAIVAHPYAPLGGCQDDHIVTATASTLLRLGFMVATFDFRGAGDSPGRTSWTGKAERSDYMSVAGFLTFYSHYLDPFRPDLYKAAEAATAATHHNTDNTEHNDHMPAVPETTRAPVFLFGGYSYGGNIVAHLPSLESMLPLFDTPATGSAAAEIRMRAQHTAESQNSVLGSARAALRKPHTGGVGSGERSPRKSMGVRIGGDEECRKSHDSRRSFTLDRDEILKGVSDIMHKTRKNHQHHHHHHKDSKDSQKESTAKSENPTPAKAEDPHLPAVPELVRHRPAYLLISPPQGLARNLLNMSFSNPFASRKSRKSLDPSMSQATLETAQAEARIHDGASLDEDERKLVRSTTLAVYGDRDKFLPLQKTREWVSSLESLPGSRFRAHEVSGASHFWVEGRVLYTLVDAVREYGGTLLESSRAEPDAVGA